MAVAGALELHLARRFLACALLVAALAATLLAGLALLLPALLPRSPWALAGPCLVVAAWLARRRTTQLGEDLAIAQTARAPLRAWSLALLAAVLLQALACLPGADPAPSPPASLEPNEVRQSLEGDLLLLRPNRLVLLDRRGELRLLPPATRFPAGLTPAPENAGRHRRQAFFAFTPLRPGPYPDDPRWQRWVWALAGMLGVVGVLAWRRVG